MAQQITKYTIGNVSKEEFLLKKDEMYKQKTSQIPYILKVDYYPNTQIMELTQIEPKVE